MDLDSDMIDVVVSLLEKPGVFTDVMTSSRDVVKSEGSQMTIVSDTGTQYIVSNHSLQ